MQRGKKCLRGDTLTARPRRDTKSMNTKPSPSRLEDTVPHPPVAHLTEEQKQALELSGEAEHAHGQVREELTEDAEELGTQTSKTKAPRA